MSLTAWAQWDAAYNKIQTRAGGLPKLNPRYRVWTANVEDSKKSHVPFVLASLWADDIKFDPSYVNARTPRLRTPA